MKIKKVSASDQVCDEIKNRIKNGYWKIDDKLPSESDLAAMFGINRLTVRMALQKLNTQGILETRVGDGSYVKHFNFHEYISEVSEFYMRPELLDDVCEYRKLIEVECARLAMERATPEELNKLESLSDQYEEEYQRLCDEDYSSEYFLRLTEADLNFHYQLCKMAHNMLYVYSYSLAIEAIRQYLNIIIKQRIDEWHKERPDEPYYAMKMHREISHAIQNKDFEKCRKLLLDMVDYNIKM